MDLCGYLHTDMNIIDERTAKSSYKRRYEDRSINEKDSGKKQKTDCEHFYFPCFQSNHIIFTLLWDTITTNTIIEIKKLIKKEPDVVNKQDVWGDTPLHVAIRKGNKELINIFLYAYKTNLNLTNQYGETPLHLLVSKSCDNQRKFQEIIIAFLRRGNKKINVNSKTEDGRTALHYAVDTGNESIVESLIMYRGTNLLIKNSYGDTALHSALNQLNNYLENNDYEKQKKYICIIKCFIYNRCRFDVAGNEVFSFDCNSNEKGEHNYVTNDVLEARNKFGQTPVELMQTIIQSYEAKNPLFSVNEEMKKLFLPTRPEDYPDDEWLINYQLHLILSGRDACLTKTTLGEIWLHTAAKYCRLKVVKFHLINGADTNARNRHGRIPIQILKEMGMSKNSKKINGNREEIMELLMPFSPQSLCEKYIKWK